MVCCMPWTADAAMHVWLRGRAPRTNSLARPCHCGCSCSGRTRVLGQRFVCGKLHQCVNVCVEGRHCCVPSAVPVAQHECSQLDDNLDRRASRNDGFVRLSCPLRRVVRACDANQTKSNQTRGTYTFPACVAPFQHAGVLGNIFVPDTHFESIYSSAKTAGIMRMVTGTPWFAGIIANQLPFLRGDGTIDAAFVWGCMMFCTRAAPTPHSISRHASMPPGTIRKKLCPPPVPRLIESA